jgi:hypothetical protein
MLADGASDKGVEGRVGRRIGLQAGLSVLGAKAKQPRTPAILRL